MRAVNYLKIKQQVIDAGYANEIEWSENLQPCNNAADFMIEYIYVICNSGMKQQIARQIFDKVMVTLRSSTSVSEVFKHEGKVKAIQYAWIHQTRLFKEYQEAHNKLIYLETLPWVGPITKWHLAKNLGLDVAKPDRHLQRLADRKGLSAQEFCKRLATVTGDRIATVDYVIWRACNLGIIRSAEK